MALHDPTDWFFGALELVVAAILFFRIQWMPDGFINFLAISLVVGAMYDLFAD